MFIYILAKTLSRQDYWFRNSIGCTKSDRYSIILPRDAMHSADYAVTRCPSQSWSWVTFSKPNPTQNFRTQPNYPTHKSLHPTQPNPSLTLDYGIFIRLYRKLLYNNCYTSQTSSQFAVKMKVRGVPHSAPTSVVKVNYLITNKK